MSIYARCCGKDYLKTKKKCEICGKNFTKYLVRVKDSDSGKSKTKTVPSLKLAKEIEAKLKSDLVEGKFFEIKQSGKIDFDKYLEYAKLHKKTWKVDLCRWNAHVKNHDYLTKNGIVKILGEMKKAGYSDCSIHHVLKLVKRVFNWAIENEYYFEVNPCNTIKPPKYDNRVTDYLSTDEISELVDYIKSWDNFRAANVILFALYTGRRKGEITSLEWKDVDLENRSITCRQTKNGKTLSFPLNEKAYEVVLDSYKHRISKYVFPSSTGHNYYHGFSLAWARLKRRIGLEHRFHNLRHTFASHLASSGKVDIYTLKTLLGHQDVSLTMRYAHLSNEAVKNANNVIDEIF